jgi:hypothetical protein
MQQLGIHAEEFASGWFTRLFVSHLPLQTVFRVFDAYLREGLNVLHRVGLAILERFQNALIKYHNKDEFLHALATLAIQYYDHEELMKVCVCARARAC